MHSATENIMDHIMHAAPVSAPDYNWDLIWIVIAGFILAFLMSFAAGANDVANSFGPVVASKVLSLKAACAFAVIFESLGAVVLGTRVSSVIWRDMVDISIYRGVDEERRLLYGEISSLIGTAVWLYTATLLKIPVSGTHSIIAATVGFSLVNHGPHQGIYWWRILRIVSSWFISPIFAGIISGALFVIIRRFILDTQDPKQAALKYMPYLHALTVFINVMSIFMYGTIIPGLVEKIPWWGVLIISSGIALLVGVGVHVFLVPWQRSRMETLANQHRDALLIRNLRSSLRSHTTTELSKEMVRAAELSYSEDEEGVVISGVIRGRTVSFTKSKTVTDTTIATTSSTSTNPTANLHRRGSDNSLRGGGIQRSKRNSIRTRQRAEKLQSLSEVEKSEFLLEVSVEMEDTVATVEEHDSSPPTPTAAFAPTSHRCSACPSLEICTKAKSDRTLTHPVSAPSLSTPISISTSANHNTGRSRSAHQQITTGSSGMLWRFCPFKLNLDLEQENEGADQTKDEDLPEVASVFAILQIVTASFTAFAHGGNDVCNTVGPLTGIWRIFTNERFMDEARAPTWLLAFGALGISLGLCVLGRKVIRTVGSSLTTILPSSGFCIGLGTACTVLIASEVGLPISSTHCIIGSVIFVGWIRRAQREDVNWTVLWKIMFGWLITMPVAAGCSAAFMALFSLAM